MIDSSEDHVRDVIRRMLNDPTRNLDLRLVARQLGVGYRSLMHWIGTDPDRRFPAELLVPLCKLIGDFCPLDFLEYQAGRLAFEIPDAASSLGEDVREAHRLMKGASEAVGSLLATVEDGIIDVREARATISELDAVMRECARVRSSLEQRISTRPLRSTSGRREITRIQPIERREVP